MRGRQTRKVKEAMHDLTTWNAVIKRGESACHGPTSKELEIHQTVDIRSITVSEDDPGQYSISLEVSFDFCESLSKEQVEVRLRELGALDEEWE